MDASVRPCGVIRLLSPDCARARARTTSAGALLLAGFDVSAVLAAFAAFAAFAALAARPAFATFAAAKRTAGLRMGLADSCCAACSRFVFTHSNCRAPRPDILLSRPFMTHAFLSSVARHLRHAALHLSATSAFTAVTASPTAPR
ncbi:hypothetical protein, partial [Paraburkholderia phenoliruptrix]|uniref:hypothetical protein n=1 Tax=Paraburkholderia phenoliruptrix TaxID=252970 RepID=UPI001C4F2138